MRSTLVLELIILALLILANGLFAMAEMAIVSARKSRLRHWARQGQRGAQLALELAASPNRFLSTIQFGITLIGILAGAFGGATLARNLSSLLRELPWFAEQADKIGFGVVVVGITFASLVFGELVPKRLALARGERIASWLAPPMHHLSRLASPFVGVIGWVTDKIMGSLGLGRQDDNPVSEDDVRLMVEQGIHSGVFHHAEIELVSRVMGLDKTPVRDIMSPIMGLPSLSTSDSLQDIEARIRDSPRLFFPLKDGLSKQILGLISLRDLWLHRSNLEADSLKLLVKAPLIVPEHVHAVKLIEALKRTQWHAALVVDEYGEITGLVSMMDIMERIAGGFAAQDYLTDTQPSKRLDGDWILDGMLGVDEASELLAPGQKLALPPGRYHTLSGLVTVVLGRLPKQGDWLPWGPFWLEVLEMDQHCVKELRITRTAFGVKQQDT